MATGSKSARMTPADGDAFFTSAITVIQPGRRIARVKFRVGRIVYLAFSRDETLLGFAFPKEWREALVESEPEKFMLPGASDLRYNWAVVRLEAIDHDEMRELVLDAWAFVVPKKVADEHFQKTDPV